MMIKSKKIVEQANFYKNKNHFNIKDVSKIYSSVKNSSHAIRLKLYHSDNKSVASVSLDGDLYVGNRKKFKESTLRQFVHWVCVGQRKQIFQDQWDGKLTDDETKDCILNHYDDYDLEEIIKKRK